MFLALFIKKLSLFQVKSQFGENSFGSHCRCHLDGHHYDLNELKIWLALLKEAHCSSYCISKKVESLAPLEQAYTRSKSATAAHGSLLQPNSPICKFTSIMEGLVAGESQPEHDVDR
jgi:hypothetical protein